MLELAECIELSESSMHSKNLLIGKINIINNKINISMIFLVLEPSYYPWNFLINIIN